MSETPEESYVENNPSQINYNDQGTNTEDSFLVDHWASKCIRFADEFQTSRSFEDAQSNISELEDSLEEYLKLRQSEGTIRVDILLYVILANIIDGLEDNKHIYTNEVPSISKILTKCLLTSGQLGRYGFQSFKQSIKAIRFLLDYYKKHSISPEKLPIVLWQSVKKVSVKGTTPYPILFPAVFHFHLETCPDTESCKTLRIDFGDLSTPIVLKHCTSTIEMIEALKTLLTQDLDFGCDHVQPSLELKSTFTCDQHSAKLSDIGLQQMVICDIDFSLSSDKSFISDIIQGQPQYSKSFQQFQVNHSGSVVIRFKSRYFYGDRKNTDRVNFYILGTKQYWEKHSQILLVDVENDDVNHSEEINDQHWLVADLNGRKVQEAEKIVDIRAFKWDLKFGSCKAGCWTYPEIHFVNKLILFPLLEDCSISFQDHVCPTIKCSDCKLTDGVTSFSVDQVFESGSVQINVRLDLKSLGLLSDTSGGKVNVNTTNFAKFKFALSIPLKLRGILIELQKESELRGENENTCLFSEEVFKEIHDLWEIHKDYYYAVWYAS